MKIQRIGILSFCLFFLNISINIAQNVGVNITGASSTILDISATDKGLLIPRMDSTSRKNIVSPAEGLMVFDSTYNNFYVYDGMTWSAISGQSDNLGNHIATQNLQLNNNWLNNDGGANKGINVDSAGQVGVGITPDANFRVGMGGTLVLDANNPSFDLNTINDVCQSFTAVNTGVLHSIEIGAFTTGSVVYSIYEGTGTGGTLLAGPFNHPDVQSPFLFPGGTLTLSAGQVYSIGILNEQGARINVSSENVYPGGTTCSGVFDADIQFKVYVEVTNPGFRITDALIQINDYTLPATDGTAGQTLITNGTGTVAWTTAANSDNQDLSLSGDVLSVSNDPSPVLLNGYRDNTDNQDLSLSGNILTLFNDNDGSPQDLSAYLDNTDQQQLSLTGDTLSLTNDATTVDLSSYLDNTDQQQLSLTGNTLSLTNDATTVDLSTYLDNTDQQDLSLSGTILSLTNDPTSVDLSTVLTNDNLGNHTATQPLQLNGNWLNNDGGASEGIYIDNTGQVGVNTIPEAPFHVDMGPTENITPINITSNGTTHATTYFWQSITAPDNGELLSITANLSNTAQTTIYRLWLGPDITGTLLYSGTIACVDGTNTFNFSGITLQRNQEYYFTLAFPVTAPHTCSLNSTNPYPGGRASNDANHDLAFSLTMLATNQGFRVEDTGLTIYNYTLPLTDGTADQVLTTDGFGNVTWAASSAGPGDNLGNHSAAQNIQLNGHWLSNDGDNEGILIDDSGQVGIGRAVGNVGAAKFEYYGTTESANGPHIQAVTSGDNYPLFQQLNWNHGNVALLFDAYYNNGWKSSINSSNFTIYNALGYLRNYVSSGNAAGDPITWAIGTSLDTLGRFGIGRDPITNKLEVEGAASKSTAGSWLANSDARLKKNIHSLSREGMLDKLLALKGVSYEWDDDKTGSQRPEGIQYGFTAQNIQAVFPDLVSQDNLGYLQTAYGTYDAMTIEALRALNEKILQLEKEKADLQTQFDELKSKNETLKTHAAILDELESSFEALKSKLKDQRNNTSSVLEHAE